MKRFIPNKPVKRWWILAALAAWSAVCVPEPALAARSLRESAVVKAVKKVSPVVVNISSEYEVRKRVGPFSGFGPHDMFDSFFHDFFDRSFERRVKRHSLGSGVVIDAKRGFILTNAHVVEKAGSIRVFFKDESEYDAKVVGADPDSDLAVLRIDGKLNFEAIQMGNSDEIMIGETVIAIGNPFGFSHTVTTGVVSAVNRSFRVDDKVFYDFIQTDASINPGNSGGPLLNIDGELIGVNTAIYANAQGIGFAIPINKAKRIVGDLIRYGEVVPAWVGIKLQQMDEALSGYLEQTGKAGLLVRSIEPDSPAQKAGVRKGDILRTINRHKVTSVSEYQNALKEVAANEEITLGLLRGGKEEKIIVKTGVYPEEKALETAKIRLGVDLSDLSARLRTRYSVVAESGVVIVAVEPGSYMSKIGANPGDVIRQMEDVSIYNLSDFKKAMIKYRDKPNLVILLQRFGQGYYITIP